MQRRLTALGFNTDGTDGRVGKDTMKAVRDFQVKAGMAPADGYAGSKCSPGFGDVLTVFIAARAYARGWCSRGR